MAKTYRGIAKNGTDWFYKGPFARATAKWMKQNGGILNENDFEKFFITNPKPIKSTYKNYTIIGMPPPSSGGIHVAQILKRQVPSAAVERMVRDAAFLKQVPQSLFLVCSSQ